MSQWNKKKKKNGNKCLEMLDLLPAQNMLSTKKINPNGNVNLERYLLLAERLDFLIIIIKIPIKTGMISNAYP